MNHHIKSDRSRHLRFHAEVVHAPAPSVVVHEHGIEYTALRPLTTERMNAWHARSREERLGSKARRTRIDALRMISSLTPQAYDALQWLLTDRRVAPGTVLEAIKTVLVRSIGPESSSVTLQNIQNNNLNVGGRSAGSDADGDTENGRGAYDDLTLEQKVEHMQKIALVLVETRALEPPQPAEDASARSIEVEVVREGENLAPGGSLEKDEE